MSHKMTVEDKGVYFVIENDFSDHDILSFNKEIEENISITDIEYQLYNFNAATSFSVNSNSIRRVSKLDAILYKRNPKIKIAIVAEKDVMKGLTNIYKTYFEIAGDDISWETEVFSTVEDARLWLNT